MCGNRYAFQCAQMDHFAVSLSSQFMGNPGGMLLGLPAPEDITGRKGTAPKKGNEGPSQGTVQDCYHTQKKQQSEAKILSSTGLS